MKYFEVNENSDNEILIISTPNNIAAEVSEEFKNLTKSLLLNTAEIFVLDFSNTEYISPNAFQPFLVFKKELKGVEKKLFSVNLSQELLNDIKARGLEQIFSPAKSIDEVLRLCGKESDKKASTKIDVAFINPFLEATKNALSVQAGVSTEPQKPYIKKENPNYDVGIAGVISLITSDFKGSITICFPVQTFLSIYNTMFDEDNKEIDADIEDAAGELLNIIYGQAKKVLNDEKGYDLQKALPTVLTADKIKIKHTGGGPTFVLPFESSAGRFHIEIEVDPLTS